MAPLYHVRTITVTEKQRSLPSFETPEKYSYNLDVPDPEILR
jgi:hypothetical protein